MLLQLHPSVIQPVTAQIEEEVTIKLVTHSFEQSSH